MSGLIKNIGINILIGYIKNLGVKEMDLRKIGWIGTLVFGSLLAVDAYLVSQGIAIPGWVETVLTPLMGVCAALSAAKKG